MRTLVKLLAVPALVLAAACGRNDAPPADAALQNDLALAGTTQPYQQQQFVSPQEQGYAPQAMQRTSTGYSSPQTRTVYRTSAPAARRRSASSGSSYPSGGGVAAEPVRHTQRDAVIGASAGAIIGATTSRDKVKGGLIGAAAGGILGAVVGHTVDVERP
jgi:hypothetical protein